MKKITKLLLLPTLLLVLFACEKDTEDLNKNIEENNILLKSGLTSGSNPNQQFVIDMQWISFLTAQTIYNNGPARNEFTASLSPISFGSPSKKVKLNDLFSDNNPVFMAAFENVFLTYEANDWVHSNGPECGKPSEGRPQLPPSGGIDNSCTSSQLYCDFIRAITHLYCLEFYLPIGFHTNQLGTGNSTNITSSAHPLDTSNSNDAYGHPCSVNNTVINNANFDKYANPLITRPYTSSAAICSNPESNIDFTEFLEN